MLREPKAADFAGAVEWNADLGVAGGRQPARELAAEDDIQADSPAIAGLDGPQAGLELDDSGEQGAVDECGTVPHELEGRVGERGYGPLQAVVDGGRDGLQAGAE